MRVNLITLLISFKSIVFFHGHVHDALSYIYVLVQNASIKKLSRRIKLRSCNVMLWLKCNEI